jgi:DNA-binding transcriptional ArsR family regulator
MAPDKRVSDTGSPHAGTDESATEAALFTSLAHPIRRQILRLAHERGYATYSDLRDALHLEPGTLYFHLDQLMTTNAPLLHQTRSKRYELTRLGQVAATFLTHAADITPSTAPVAPATTHPKLRHAVHLLGFAPLFRYLTNRPDHLIVEALVLTGAIAYLVTLARLVFIGFLPINLYPLPPLLPAVAAIASWLGLTLGAELITRFRYHATQDTGALLAGSIYAWLPQALYACAHLLARPLLTAIPPLTFTLLFATLTWSLWICVQGVAITKRVTLRKAALTTIILTNITLLATALATLVLPHA